MYAYSELKSKFDRGTTSKFSYMLENNTQVITNNKYQFTILLHGNKIADYPDDKTIILYSAGWHTFTTKDRLNHILHDNQTGFTVYQDHYAWYIFDRYNPNIPKQNRQEFYEGITFIYETSPLMGIGWRLSTE